jgi:hypothetical protein
MLDEQVAAAITIPSRKQACKSQHDVYNESHHFTLPRYAPLCAAQCQPNFQVWHNVGGRLPQIGTAAAVIHMTSG